MNKIKTRHTRRAMRAKRRGKHTTRKWYGKYKKNYTRKIVKQIREMQKYIMLEQKIQNIQNDMNEIKKNQELILSILEKKLQ